MNIDNIMKVAIIGTVGVPACYGGYETLVENLLTHKQRDDIEYTVYCSAKAYKDRPRTYKGARLVYLPFNANGPQAIIYDTLSLIHAYFTSDQILSLGTVGSFILPLTRRLSRKRLSVNLDGLDDAREKFNSFSQRVIGKARRLAAKYADQRISDNQGIKDYVSRVYGKDSVLIEYGGDNAQPVRDDKRLKEKYGLEPEAYVFKVARIEPENNIETILKTFADIPEETLVLVGNWNRSEFGRTMKERYGSLPNMRLMDPIYEPCEINLLRTNCKLYIHGHSAGGTNPSLVEAMSLGLPIIANGVVYNRETTEHEAVYFNDQKSLAEAVRSLCADKDRRDALAAKMKEIATRRYRWETIVRKYENLF